MPQRSPFCRWLAVVVDHFSRRVMGPVVFEAQPSSGASRSFLHRTISRAGATPKFLITDHGRQFVAKGCRRWCRRQGIGHRFGAVGKYSSLAARLPDSPHGRRASSPPPRAAVRHSRRLSWPIRRGRLAAYRASISSLMSRKTLYPALQTRWSGTPARPGTTHTMRYVSSWQSPFHGLLNS
jgi:transposase InsO family protein